MELAPHILILAAGKGRRMRSTLPKVLHPVLGKPMLHYVLDAARAVPHRSISLIVGHGEEQVREQCAGYEGLRFFRQEQQLGTAHAVRSAEAFLKESGGRVLILSGDVILVSPESLRRLLETHAAERADCTVASATLLDPRGYGRLIARGGRVVDIKEDLDCSEDERAIREVNAGVYCFDSAKLVEALQAVNNSNAQGEYYLPDAVRLMAQRGARVSRFSFVDPAEMLGINDLAAHGQVEGLLRERLAREWMLRGVRIVDPRATYIDGRCRIEPGAVIEPGCVLANAAIGAETRVEAYSRVCDSTIGARAHVKQGSYIEESEVGDDCKVGPYAHLRPGTKLGPRVKIGNFVEVKKSVLGADSQASHLTYIGDAEIGERVNLGCGFITCNFDGVNKNKTIIEDDVFVGSDSQAVAPVRLGARSFIATGTCVTEDVPEDSLAISRGRQTNKAGYAKKYRKPKKQSQAA